MTESTTEIRFCGQVIRLEQLNLIKSVIKDCCGISRTELANTICELLEWRRPNGKLKTVECRDLIEEMSAIGMLRLPSGRSGRPRGSRTSVSSHSAGSEIELNGKKNEFEPIEIFPVSSKDDNARWRSMVDRHHYLGHRVPFGAHIRYFIRVHNPEPLVVGCLQFSSPAWRMAARDRHIGWDDAVRSANLQRVVCNSRFLILPTVRIKNLASSALSLVARRIATDWENRFAIRPLLLETLVDTARFSGTCYRAANWLEAGRTTGRGRNDQQHRHHGESPKTVFLYPLSKEALRQLRGEE